MNPTNLTKGTTWALLAMTVALVAPRLAQGQPQTFQAGSLIIPMDTDHQDDGMLQAFGLVFQLLSADVPIEWVIDPDKLQDGADFQATAVDVQTEATIEHGYRGGPFVIAAAHAERAESVIADWHASHVTTVHRATAPFDGTVARQLTAAPVIAVFADGNEDIAMDYLNAAGIPDPQGREWDDDSLGVVTLEQVRGPSLADTSDGALFDENGLPVYCELMTMHWGVNDRDEGVIAEMRSFLSYPTHLMAECQAVNAIENAANGHFLTPNGFLIDDKPHDVDVVTVHLPFGQLDGEFETVGGSEPSYSLPEGDAYYDEGVVMLTEAGTPVGTADVWMTGFFGGQCLIDPKETEDPECESGVGKVSYLAGHRYSTDTPMSENPDTQGTRLFLNSLFEADCTVAAGQPQIDLELTAPAWTPEPAFDLTVRYVNSGRGIGYDLELTLPLPAGVTYESAVPEPSAVEAGLLRWEVGNLGPDRFGSITVGLSLDSFGTYEHQAFVDYRVGWNDRDTASNLVTTVYALENPADDAVGDGGGGPDTGDGGDAGAIEGDATVSDAAESDAAESDATSSDSSASEDDDTPAGSGQTPTDSCSCAASANGSLSGGFLVLLLALIGWRRRR